MEKTLKEMTSRELMTYTLEHPTLADYSAEKVKELKEIAVKKQVGEIVLPTAFIKTEHGMLVNTGITFEELK